jgi:hexosaminidase
MLLRVSYLLMASALLAAPAPARSGLSPGAGLGIIPRPVTAERGEGEFTVTFGTRLFARGISPGTIRLINARFRAAGGFELSESAGTESGAGWIRMAADSLSSRDPESYRLTVERDGVTITGGGEAGVFYGVQTLFQLFPPSFSGKERIPSPGLTIPFCSIEDSPRFRWRGMHLDVSRHFFPVEFIRTYIDILAMHKMNVFHWHLTDDQGWRIEIRKYPELTRRGAWRVDREDRDWADRPPRQPGEEETYGGFYTQDQVREIVRYAQERFITIVPEIEMPAHTLAALAAYPAYSCTGGPFSVPPGSYWPISTIYCAGNDSTFAFLQDVLTEVMDLFPGRYIHIGGDEADKSEWKRCPKCQSRIRTEGLRDESELQSYFIRRIGTFLSSRGRSMIGWDEILEGGLPPGAAVMSWRGAEGGIAAARLGHDVVMSPGSYTYLSEYQGPPSLEPPAGGGYLPLSKVYAFEPVDDSLTREERTHVLGAEGCLWSEYIPTPGRAMYMLLPRLAALAEVLWTPERGRDWSDFAARVPRLMKRYEASGYTSARSAYAVRIASEADPGSRGVAIALSTELPSDSIVFTTDGSEPGKGSRPYAPPLIIHSSARIRASAVLGESFLPSSSDTVLFHRGIFKPVSVTYPSTRYTAGGNRSLTDGLVGSTDHADGRWQGYEGVDFDAIVDLGDTAAVSALAVRFLEKTGSWIFFPSRVTFALSTDGTRFTSVGSFDVPPVSANEEARAREWECTFAAQEARYVRFGGRTIGTCPVWHPGAGGKAWIFVDELVVR